MNDVQSLGVFAEVAAGQVVGGAVGRTWGQCCELQQLAVAPEHRRQGVGERLLQHFEKAAATRGCTLVYLDTFSFQAPDFYRRCGYHVAFETRGFAQDIVKYTLHKLLPASRT